jgi:chromosome segregation ATPase
VLQTYTPSQEIVALAENSGMSDTAKNLFYAHVPKLTDNEEFNTACTNGEETIVLGCYTGFDFSTDTDIYVYNVTKPELAGIKEVTAAHEMLHAAYEQLSANEKKQVDAMVLAMYQKINNPRLTKTIESYKKQNPDNPGVVANELHSILATEYRTLDADLEKYYTRYFSDRSKVVLLSEQYESVFTNKEAEAERLSGEINLRKSEIEQLKNSLDSQNAALNSLSQKMEDYLSSGNTSAYNQLVPTYNQKANQYNADVAKVTVLINETNELITQINQNVVQQQELINSIDSKYQPTQ